MNFKNKMIFSFALTAGLAVLLPAQDANAHRGGRGDRCGLSTVTLTQDQQDAIDVIRNESRQAAQDIRNDDSLDRQAKRDAIRALFEIKRTDIDAVLTNEQRAEIATCKEEAQAARITRRVERLTEALTLDVDTATKITQILTDAAEAKRDLRENFEGTREQLRTAMKEQHEATKAEIRALLTPAQAEQFDQLCQGRQNRAGRFGRRAGRRGGRAGARR